MFHIEQVGIMFQKIVDSRMVNIIEYFVNHRKELNKISLDEGRDVLSLASYVAVYSNDRELKNNGLNLLYYGCFAWKDLELKEIWNIYWILVRALFEDCNARLKGNLDELYHFIFEKVRNSVIDTYEKIGHSNSNLVILSTDQFLGGGHAPSRRVMDYAYTFITSLKKKVIIVNDACYHYYPYEWLEQTFFPYYDEGFETQRLIAYKGIEIPYMQISTYMPDLAAINDMLHRIYSLQPELVYNIGGSSLVSDLCGLFTKTACFPCSTDIPVTMSEYLLVGRNLDKKDAERLGRLEPYQKVIETVVNYDFMPGTKSYERSLFDIPENSFVIGIVGNRLEIDLSEEIILVIDRIIAQQEVHFLMIGSLLDINRIKEKVARNENLHFAGELEQAVQAIKLCDVYLNPKRKGGGRSSFEALAQGVPVVTLKYGDVYYTCGDAFAVDTYADIPERVNRYILDKSYFELAKREAVERAGILSDLSGTQKKILEQIL